MKLITRDDIIETYLKLYQRGLGYVLSKFNLSQDERVKSTFNSVNIEGANYWIIPRLRQRWNKIISGNANCSYEQYVFDKYLKGKQGLKLLSLGSGVCSHELIFARFNCFSEVRCIDFSETILNKARKKAKEQGLTNMVFTAENVYKLDLADASYDMILFHASLHHFAPMNNIIKLVRRLLKPDGILVINEYVGPNRIQVTTKQKRAINNLLKYDIPKPYKQRFKSNYFKSRISGPGYLRMLVTDPSEAIESKQIIPEIHKHFSVVEEKTLGGNITMLLFKDIAHNFVSDTPETNKLLKKVFEVEDEFLKSNSSDFVFGVYR